MKKKKNDLPKYHFNSQEYKNQELEKARMLLVKAKKKEAEKLMNGYVYVTDKNNTRRLVKNLTTDYLDFKNS